MLCVLVVNRFEFFNKVFVIAKNVKLKFVKYLLFNLNLYCIVDCKYCFKYINLILRKI